MLTLLRVRDLAIIDHLEVEFGPGLNVITGETGAGKSILISALSLVLGERGRSGLVRSGASAAEIEAIFDVGEEGALSTAIDEAGLSSDADGELLVRRVVHAGGRTRAYLNGRLATAGQLGELVGGLVDISSQHEHHTLVDPATHLTFLDAFGALDTEQIRAAYEALRAADAALRAAEGVVGAREQREDLLRFQVGEIDAVAPAPEEDLALEEARARLRHSEKLATVTAGAEDTLYARDGAVGEVIGRVAHEVRGVAAIDPRLVPLADALEGLVVQLEEVSRDLGDYARGVAHDDTALTDVEERLGQLKRLMRKYGGDLASVLAFRDEAAAELAELEGAEERLEALESAREEAIGAAADAARALSRARRESASQLGAHISEELATLGMGGARVEVQVERLTERGAELTVDGARLTSTGIDRVELLIAPNRGEAPRPLAKIASGGELSRAMLAIKRVLAGIGNAGLYVFDEVDAGVGGAVAEVIGRKLADVAAHHQVICVTHLAPIAAYADRHFRVAKVEAGGRTLSTVARLDEAARGEELARMLGGIDITNSTRKAAKDLLRSARESAR